MKRLQEWARRLQAEALALWFCTQHPRTPVIAKVLALVLVAYAFSPIDLIPDFIPVIGLLDDLVILTAGIWLVLKLVPGDVFAECRGQAERWLAEKRPQPRSTIGAALIIALWLATLIFVSWLAWPWARDWFGP